MKKHFLFYSFLYISLNIAVPPQNKADHLLLRACKACDEFQIAQALCLGANRQVTNENDETTENIIRGDRDRQFTTSQSIDLVDNVRNCQMQLYDYPGLLIKDFELIDKEEMPRHNYWNQLRLGIINGIDYYGDTVVHRAIRLGTNGDGLVKKMIGVRGWFNLYTSIINLQNNDGDTPLHLVMKSSENIRSEESRRRICLFLVSRGADATIKNKKGDTPITCDVSFWLNLCSSMKQPKTETLCSRINRLLFCRKRLV